MSVPLGSHHVAASFIKRVDLLRSEVAGDLAQISDDLLDKRLVFAGLECNKVASALLGDLDKGIAGHVLDT